MARTVEDEVTPSLHRQTETREHALILDHEGGDIATVSDEVIQGVEHLLAKPISVEDDEIKLTPRVDCLLEVIWSHMQNRHIERLPKLAHTLNVARGLGQQQDVLMVHPSPQTPPAPRRVNP